MLDIINHIGDSVSLESCKKQLEAYVNVSYMQKR